MLSIDNSTLSILYPTFAFLLKLPRLQLAGDATAGGKERRYREGVRKRASRNFLPAIAHRLTGNTSHKRGGAMPRFRVFVILASPRENFGPCPINRICSMPLSVYFSRRERCSCIQHLRTFSAPPPTQCPTLVYFSISNLFPSQPLRPPSNYRRGLLFMSMDNSLKLQKRFQRRAIRQFSEIIEFWI